jgi:glycosyltransferase involved in cell wall biosynthesis
LIIAGVGPEADALRILATELDVAEDVSFIGRVPDADLPTLFAAADLAVVPSRELEGFGYVVLEAYAAGTPVLSTTVGGLRDVVGGFDPDRLVAPNPEAIAASIRAALMRPENLPDRAACRAYAAGFAWDRIAPEIERVFNDTRWSHDGSRGRSIVR